MNIYIIYDSFFGNTEKISRVISEHLSEKNKVQIFKVEETETLDLKDADLLIVGSPTRAFEPTKSIVSFIKNFEKEGLKGLKIALFDTRMNVKSINNVLLTFLVKFRGYACTSMESLFLKKEAEIIGEPRGFLVLDSKGPLEKGEEDSARTWADTLISLGGV